MMKKSDFSRFGDLLSALGDLHTREVSEGMGNFYWLSLKRFTWDEVVAGILSHVKNTEKGAYWPMPSDLIRAIEGSSEERALLTWSVVEKAIRRVGAYESVAFDDRLIHNVIDHNTCPLFRIWR